MKNKIKLSKKKNSYSNRRTSVENSLSLDKTLCPIYSVKTNNAQVSLKRRIATNPEASTISSHPKASTMSVVLEA